MARMPRQKSANDTPLNLLLPQEWLDEAKELAADLSPDGAPLSRADALRMCLRRGIDSYRAELKGKVPSERHIKKR
jgi:hypothetical protein